MKKCAKCHAEYADEYDACPTCAEEQTAREKNRKRTIRRRWLLCIGLTLLLLGFLIDAVAPSSRESEASTTPAIENPVLASAVGKVLSDARFENRLAVAEATYGGAVVVTITGSKADWEPEASAAAAKTIADFVFSEVPDVTRVAVLDENGEMIESWDEVR